MGKYQIELRINRQPLMVIPAILGILGHFGISNPLKMPESAAANVLLLKYECLLLAFESGMTFFYAQLINKIWGFFLNQTY